VGGAGFRGAFAMGLVVGFNTASGTVPFLLGLGTVIVSSRTAGLGTVAIGSFGLGLGALFFLAGAFAVRLPKGGAWTRATPWISGVGLTYLAFAHLRERFPAIADFVRDPHYALGIVAGALLVMGIALGLGHLLATRGGSTLGRFAKPLGLASILPAVIGGALFFSWLPHEHGNAPPITWLTNEEQGRAAATAAGKPVIVSFNAQWCCREIERDTFPDPRVREEAKRFIAIAVDATDDELPDTKRLQEKYRIIGLPTVIIFDSAGREVSRVDSFVQPAELLAQMKKVPR
jgi:thiol:disulfide interchange protein DsbD